MKAVILCFVTVAGLIGILSLLFGGNILEGIGGWRGHRWRRDRGWRGYNRWGWGPGPAYVNTVYVQSSDCNNGCCDNYPCMNDGTCKWHSNGKTFIGQPGQCIDHRNCVGNDSSSKKSEECAKQMGIGMV